MKTVPIEQLGDEFERQVMAAQTAINRGIARTAEQTVELLQSVAPVRTGAFRNAWRIVARPDGITVRNAVPMDHKHSYADSYAAFVVYGTSQRKANYDAFLNQEVPIMRMFKTNVRKELTKVRA